MIWWIIGGIVILILIWLVGTYNVLIVKRNRIENAWSQIDVQLKRRYDLIPNLVKIVKRYAKHEKETFEMVTKARTQFMNAKDIKGKAKASNQMTDALKSLFAVSENYPNLKANENFMQLQEELSGTENKIAYARQFYNDSVLGFNEMIQKFPVNLIAGMFSFGKKDYFKAKEMETKELNLDL